MFAALGLEEHSAFAGRLAKELKYAARKHLINLDTLCAKYRCQTAQAMAIYYKVFDYAEAKEAFKVLLEIIDECGGRIDCGALGLRVIFHTLTRFGKSDLALSMITRPEFPSYGYMIKHGATTLWELFNPIECVQSSCNHHFFGDIINWFIKSLAGIQFNPQNDDINYTVISPDFINGMDFAKCSLLTPCGWVRSEWERKPDGNIKLKVSIPEGMRAELLLNGWQNEKGFTCQPLTGENEITLYPYSYHNSLRVYAK